MEELALPSHEDRILCAGCGAGLHVIRLAHKHPDYGHLLGMDRSSSLIEMAKRSSDLWSLGNIEFMQSELVSYKRDGELFDTIILGNGELLPLHRISILTAAIDLLEEGGCIIGRDFLANEANAKHIEDALYYVDSITAKDYSSLIEKIGYSNVDIRNQEASNASDFEHIPQIDSFFDSQLESAVIIVRK